MYSFYVFGGQLNKISDRKAGYITVETKYLQLHSMFKTEYTPSWKLCVLFLCEIVPHIWTNEDDMQVFVFMCVNSSF